MSLQANLPWCRSRLVHALTHTQTHDTAGKAHGRSRQHPNHPNKRFRCWEASERPGHQIPPSRAVLFELHTPQLTRLEVKPLQTGVECSLTDTLGRGQAPNPPRCSSLRLPRRQAAAGQTPLDISLRFGHGEVEQLLRGTSSAPPRTRMTARRDAQPTSSPCQCDDWSQATRSPLSRSHPPDR